MDKSNNTTHRRARAIALYLPQFHPIPENDEWWGKGFTEWTNVAKAKPLFHGHYQPRVPADLGFYDLRVPETRLAQAEMAKEYGIEAFCYWHYWFAGRRILERPFNEVLRSGEPNFPFCLGWANQSWTGIWYGEPKRVLIEQTYPGLKDHEAHFYTLLEAFQDPRYLTVDGKPLLVVFRPRELPEAKRVMDFWRELAVKSGLKGLHLAGIDEFASWDPIKDGFDAAILNTFLDVRMRRIKDPAARLRRKLRTHPKIGPLLNRLKPEPLHVYPYKEVLSDIVVRRKFNHDYYPSILPNWDNTPRSGMRGTVLCGSTPELFRTSVREAIRAVAHLPAERRIIIVKSWNEWAEGNHLEPDLKFGKAYLKVLREEVLT